MELIKLKKYKEYVTMMRKLRFDDDEIESKLYEMEELSGWTPITFAELKEMGEDELKELLSFCWHEGKPRCSSIGITNVEFKETKYGWNVNWSDQDGDPNLNGWELDDEIDNIGDDEWNYGLYKKQI